MPELGTAVNTSRTSLSSQSLWSGGNAGDRSSDEVSITILSTAASEGSREAPPSYREDSSRLSREQRQQKAGVLGAL